MRVVRGIMCVCVRIHRQWCVRAFISVRVGTSGYARVCVSVSVLIQHVRVLLVLLLLILLLLLLLLRVYLHQDMEQIFLL